MVWVLLHPPPVIHCHNRELLGHSVSRFPAAGWAWETQAFPNAQKIPAESYQGNELADNELSRDIHLRSKGRQEGQNKSQVSPPGRRKDDKHCKDGWGGSHEGSHFVII
jgi:hypothetical protein